MKIRKIYRDLKPLLKNKRATESFNEILLLIAMLYAIKRDFLGFIGSYEILNLFYDIYGPL